MARLIVEEDVAAKPEETFRVFADIPRSADHVTAITGIEMLTEGSIGTGSRWKETRVMHGRAETLELQMAEFSPPHRYSVVADAHGARYESVFEFTPSKQGTKVTLSFSGKAYTLPAKVLAVVTRPLMAGFKKAMAKDLADLKRVAESNAAAGASGPSSTV